MSLVSRDSLSDHQALLANEVLAELGRGDVQLERFEFDRDAALCRPVVSSRTRARTAPKLGHADSPAVTLADVRGRSPDHRVLVFAEASKLFDGYTGAPAAWVSVLLQWPFRVLLTPLPRERWGQPERALQEIGVQVLPLNQGGLLGLMKLLGEAPLEPPRSEPEGAARAVLHDRTPYRWLERNSPEPSVVEALCRDLKSDLGPQGFAWLASCSAYPEVHWGITVRLGRGLLPGRSDFERLLPRLARLVWFRRGYIPDWLRGALLARLEPEYRSTARALLRDMLEAVVADRTHESPLRIAVGEDRGLFSPASEALAEQTETSRSTP